ncbi:Gfo/Idh/MocA family protein [Aporhodopirellula aestuarii]|uniref:Gfo/Idh/MocA family oxidoreductase n=1 Tax=Aporhodopirellula aestuarii TaxID=2950107 RepID=A0ABT0TWQ6_9BACT|nr:Gfo/Idh/MocA family oxidoreductase [Aporhodopirellula aestuarii]MCM2369035.1 Gfo/Idh/MocA family oxidoreductase [Aporhodopirellula aestuarii]
MKRLNRREFSVSASAATLTTGLALGVHTSAAAATAGSPNEALGVAVCGVNGRGMSHVTGFHNDPRSVIRVLVDVDAKVGESQADKVEKMQGSRPRVVRDVREILESDDIDIVTCATPNHWHAMIAVWAMQAGKDVYIEKPISHNIHEGRALVAAAKKYGRMFQTGTQCRSSLACIDAMKFIADGGIGEVKLARGLCYKRRKSIGPLGDYPVPDGVDFNLWSGPASYTDPKVTRQKFHYDWHWQRHYGNGDSGNQGPHQTDIARWGLGLERHPNSILTYGGRLGYQAERKDPNYVDAGDTANTQVSIYDYGDKTIVFETRGLSVDNSADTELNELFGSNRGNKIGVVFYGSEGYVVQGPNYTTCRAFDLNKKETRAFTHNARTSGQLNDVHMSNFLDAVVARDSSILNADARCGHLSAAIAHLGNTSYYLGQENRVAPNVIAEAVEKFSSLDDDTTTLRRTLRHLRDNGVDPESEQLSLGPQLNFDPEAERYLGNDDANAMLTREYREGFEVPAAEAV